MVTIVLGAVVVGYCVRRGWWPRQGDTVRSRPMATRLQWSGFALLAGEWVTLHASRIGKANPSPYLPVNLVAFGCLVAAARMRPHHTRGGDR